MKAILVRAFGGPEVLKLDDAPEPKPAASQVLVRVKAVGVNPVDAYIRSGTYARKPVLPYIPGTDIAGIVETVGAAVTRVKPGDRVYAWVSSGGGCAEFAVCEEAQAAPLPDRASFQQGAALGVPYATAWRALFIRGHARSGETILVHGASGGVGTAVVQIARAHGMRVIGTAGTKEGVVLVRDQGAHEVLNHRDPDYMQAIMPLTSGRGVDLVLEMLANVNLDRDLDVLAMHGRVVVIGNRGRVEIDPRKAMAKDGAILGLTLFNATPEELREIHAGLVAGLENGSLKPVVGKELPLSDAAKAHEVVMEPGAFGKVVLIP
jgi:NADPH2:quinone reductase